MGDKFLSKSINDKKILPEKNSVISWISIVGKPSPVGTKFNKFWRLKIRG